MYRYTREAAEGAKKTLDKAKETMKSRASQFTALVTDVRVGLYKL